jgi:hypothetical protein
LDLKIAEKIEGEEKGLMKQISGLIMNKKVSNKEIWEVARKKEDIKES